MHKTKQESSLWRQLSPYLKGFHLFFPSCYPLFGRIEYYHGYWTG